ASLSQNLPVVWSNRLCISRLTELVEAVALLGLPLLSRDLVACRAASMRPALCSFRSRPAAIFRGLGTHMANEFPVHTADDRYTNVDVCRLSLRLKHSLHLWTNTPRHRLSASGLADTQLKK